MEEKIAGPKAPGIQNPSKHRQPSKHGELMLLG